MDQSTSPAVLKTGLYNVVTDAAEAHDLSAQHPDKVKELQALWDGWNQKNVPALWTKDSKDEAPDVSSDKSKEK